MLARGVIDTGPLIPSLFITSLIQTAGHKMAALKVVFLRLSNIDFFYYFFFLPEQDQQICEKFLPILRFCFCFSSYVLHFSPGDCFPLESF